MKLFITEDLTPKEAEFIRIWRERKGYQDGPISLGECIELIIAFSYNLHVDFSDGRFFNKILINQESVIGYDGEELIDILWYEARSIINKRIAQAGTFHEESV